MNLSEHRRTFARDHFGFEAEVQALVSHLTIDHFPLGIAVHQFRQGRIQQVNIVEGLETFADKGPRFPEVIVARMLKRADHSHRRFLLPDSIDQSIEFGGVILL